MVGQARCEEVPSVKPKLEDGLAWFDVRDWGVEGRGWSQTERYFDRLPAKAKGKVRDAVWQLSRHSAGMVADSGVGRPGDGLPSPEAVRARRGFGWLTHWKVVLQHNTSARV
jgi:hypothetical protein